MLVMLYVSLEACWQLQTNMEHEYRFEPDSMSVCVDTPAIPGHSSSSTSCLSLLPPQTIYIQLVRQPSVWVLLLLLNIVKSRIERAERETEGRSLKINNQKYISCSQILHPPSLFLSANEMVAFLIGQKLAGVGLIHREFKGKHIFSLSISLTDVCRWLCHF